MRCEWQRKRFLLKSGGLHPAEVSCWPDACATCAAPCVGGTRGCARQRPSCNPLQLCQVRCCGLPTQHSPDGPTQASCCTAVFAGAMASMIPVWGPSMISGDAEWSGPPPTPRVLHTHACRRQALALAASGARVCDTQERWVRRLDRRQTCRQTRSHRPWLDAPHRLGRQLTETRPPCPTQTERAAHLNHNP